jgi:branched-subunit amino acid transport protein AzlD
MVGSSEMPFLLMNPETSNKFIHKLINSLECSVASILRSLTFTQFLTVDVFMAVTMKNAIFWDVTFQKTEFFFYAVNCQSEF